MTSRIKSNRDFVTIDAVALCVLNPATNRYEVLEGVGSEGISALVRNDAGDAAAVSSYGLTTEKGVVVRDPALHDTNETLGDVLAELRKMNFFLEGMIK